MNKTQALKTTPASSVMSSGLDNDVSDVLLSIAEAAPMLSAPIMGTIEALKQIDRHTQVHSW
jgi:hypothetical protein